VKRGRGAGVAAALALFALGPGCDDSTDESFPVYSCSQTSCDPACKALMTHPPDGARSHCSPAGPICDYSFSGQTWEIACGDDGHRTARAPVRRSISASPWMAGATEALVKCGRSIEAGG
jgi:hypothetical protein